jgi:hypothetical protein
MIIFRTQLKQKPSNCASVIISFELQESILTMKNNIFKLFFLLLTIVFSIIWISDKLTVVLENEKYGFYEMAENSDTENQTENKLKTQFLEEIELLNFSRFIISSTQKNNTFYLFKIKEVSFENLTPPPKVV